MAADLGHRFRIGALDSRHAGTNRSHTDSLGRSKHPSLGIRTSKPVAGPYSPVQGQGDHYLQEGIDAPASKVSGAMNIDGLWSLSMVPDSFTKSQSPGASDTPLSVVRRAVTTTVGGWCGRVPVTTGAARLRAATRLRFWPLALGLSLASSGPACESPGACWVASCALPLACCSSIGLVSAPSRTRCACSLIKHRHRPTQGQATARQASVIEVSPRAARSRRLDRTDRGPYT